MEKVFGDVCNVVGYDFEIFEGEGVFYGLKFEFILIDVIGWNWQCGMFQVDSNLFECLDVNFIGVDGEKYCFVMLYCVMLGLFEWFIGILIEEYVGKLLFWLVLCQVVVVLIVLDVDDFVVEVVVVFKDVGICVELDICNEKINYKICEYSFGKVFVIMVIGC